MAANVSIESGDRNTEQTELTFEQRWMLAIVGICEYSGFPARFLEPQNIATALELVALGRLREVLHYDPRLRDEAVVCFTDIPRGES